MAVIAPANAAWRTSERGSQSGECVEVAAVVR
ncbi:DUF397 domain-containing protein [Actinoallomurus sp. NPDC052274]